MTISATVPKRIAHTISEYLIIFPLTFLTSSLVSL
jgi:hypothetical protein